MNPISHLNPIEQNICNKADLHKIPIAGNIELLPLCNMSCNMCYAKMTREEMERHHAMIDYKQWLEKAKEMSDAGTIFLLLTGGEPFLYPHFKELYFGLKKMGFILSINSNGTLITDEIADYLASDPPRRVNITLYGASNETYAKLCHNPFGLTQTIRGIKKLIDRGVSVKLNCSLTPDNIHEQTSIYQLSKDLGVPIEMGFYMFPAVRINNKNNIYNRLTPIQAAKARFTYEKLSKKDYFDHYVLQAINSLENYKETQDYRTGYLCRSGHSVYWINYDGTLSACSFTFDKQIDIFKMSFSDAWHELVEHVSSSKMSRECYECEKKVLCGRCAASAITETGTISGIPEYYCQLTEEYIRLLYQHKENMNNENQ